MIRAPRGLTLEERLRHRGWNITEDGCWNWKGTIHKRSGYGVLQFQYRSREVHVLAYGLWVSPVTPGAIIRHSCDNRICMNPEHLLSGTHADNMNDKMQRGRYRCLEGAAHPNAKLTTQEVLDIRKEYVSGRLSQNMLAEVYGVSSCTIWSIVNLKTRRNA